jgi:hypothetical protein
VTWLDYDASRRGTLIIPEDSKSRILSEPSPDVAIGVVSEFVGKASYKGISGEASAKVTESIAELGKRTQTIMFLREALFRLNEMQTANKIDPAEVTKLYTKVIDVAVELAKVDVAVATKQAISQGAGQKELLEQMLGSQTAVLQVQFDELMKKTPTTKGPDGKAFVDMDAYAEHLVETRPEFKGDSVYGIRARGGPKLESFIAELRKATE